MRESIPFGIELPHEEINNTNQLVRGAFRVKTRGGMWRLDLLGSDGQNPTANASTLASHSAVPRGTNVAQMNANRAIRIAAQQGL